MTIKDLKDLLDTLTLQNCALNDSAVVVKDGSVEYAVDKITYQHTITDSSDEERLVIEVEEE